MSYQQLPDNPSPDDLVVQIDFLLYNWNVGVTAFRNQGYTTLDAPGWDDIIAILPDVLSDIVDHKKAYNISIQNYDCNKLVNYVAWHIVKQFPGKFDTTTLFHGHLHFIDEAKQGYTLFAIPNLPLISENLTKFHANGEKLAPYTFLKGLDLAFCYCLPEIPDHQVS